MPGYDFTQVKRVAVIDVVTANLNPAAQNEIADLFSTQLMQRGFSVVERAQISKVMAEQDFQHGGATNEAEAVKIGQILNTDAILMANVPELNGKMRMTVKLIDVKTGEWIWSGEGTANTHRGALTVGGAAVGMTLGAVAGHELDRHHGGYGRHGRYYYGGGGSAGTVLGGVAGGAAGGAAAYYLSPDAAKLLRKLVGKISEGMPSKIVEMPAAPPIPYQETAPEPPVVP